MITRDQICAEAVRLVGTPYQHQARLPGVAIDCVGLVVCTARALGIPLTDISNYPRFPDGTLRPRLAEQLDAKPLADRQPGDIITFWYSKRGVAAHVGILVSRSPEHLVHTSADIGRVVRHRIDDFWSVRMLEAFSFRGV